MGGSGSRELKETAALPASEAIAAFGFDLFHPLAAENPNVFFSPLSLFVSLGMAAAGAEKGKDAEEQLRWLLRHDFSDESTAAAFTKMLEEIGSADEKVQLLMANSCWAKETIRPEYIEGITKTFRAAADQLTTEGPINEWVSKNTMGKVPSLIDTVDPLDKCYLINAVYFKGAWHTPFEASETTDGEFFSSKGTPTKCKMMHASRKIPFVTDKKHFSMVCLPYGDSQRFSSIILLPSKEGQIDDLIEWLTPETFKTWLGKLAHSQVNLTMPRFKMEYGTTDVLVPLKKLGLNAVQEDGMFSKMTPSPLVKLDRLFHRAVIEVNEEGAEAAAASAAAVTEKSFSLPQDFNVNRPFVFAIVDNTNCMCLFLGKITSPEFN